MDNEFTEWFDKNDDRLLVMECEDIAREALFAGAKAAQQSALADEAGKYTPRVICGGQNDIGEVCASCSKDNDPFPECKYIYTPRGWKSR